MMEYTHLTDLTSMLQALLAGVAMGVYYDIFRFLRRVFKFSELSVVFQDLLFWISSAVFLFFICLKLNAGFMRIYFVIFTMTGWLIYFMTAGKLIFRLFDGILKILNRIFDTIKKGFLKISEGFYLKIR